MSHTPPTSERRIAHISRSEQAAIQNLVERLTRQFPEIGRGEIEHAVRGEYEGYENSKIRDFVPILVERSVRGELAQPAPRPSG